MTCPKCGREWHPWPIKRPNLCAPKEWVNCIRPFLPTPSYEEWLEQKR
jgi:hypothetical protein